MTARRESLIRWIARTACATLVACELVLCAVCATLGLWLWPGIPNLILLIIAVSMTIDAWRSDAMPDPQPLTRDDALRA